MNRTNKNISKDQINRLYYLKYEYKKIILKSIIQTRSVSPLTRIYAQIKLLNYKKKSFISRQINVCLMTGRNRGTYKLFHLCRHAMLKLGTIGALHNTKIKSW